MLHKNNFQCFSKHLCLFSFFFCCCFKLFGFCGLNSDLQWNNCFYLFVSQMLDFLSFLLRLILTFIFASSFFFFFWCKILLLILHIYILAIILLCILACARDTHLCVSRSAVVSSLLFSVVVACPLRCV